MLQYYQRHLRQGLKDMQRKNNQRRIKQREIYMCDLTKDSIDSEQSGCHPVLIAACDIRNNSSNNVVVFPLTHAIKKVNPHIIFYIVQNMIFCLMMNLLWNVKKFVL